MTGERCVFCAGDGGEVLFRDELLRVVLVDDADYPGFVRVIANAHVPEMTDLAPAERAAFLRAYLGAIKAGGFVGTVDFTKRGWPAGPFYRAGFFPYPRSVRLVSWTVNPDISLAGTPIVYEIQV